MQAMRYYAQAADLGDSEAEYQLGRAYCYPEQLTEASRALAFRRIESAAMGGHIAACYELARCYLLGYGTEKNEEAALSYYMDAAAQGHQIARCMAALCHAAGLGSNASWQEAQYWIQTSH